MPRQSKPVTDTPRVATRAENANKHPGVAENAGKRKRRTAEEIKIDQEAKQAAKEEKERNQKEKVERIATLENKMAAEDAKPRPKPRPLRRTSSHALIPLYDDTPEEIYNPSNEGSEGDSDATDVGPATKKRPPKTLSRPTVIQPAVIQPAVTNPTVTKPKESVRATINTARQNYAPTSVVNEKKKESKGNPARGQHLFDGNNGNFR
jgi:hypothetical protein